VSQPTDSDGVNRKEETRERLDAGHQAPTTKKGRSQRRPSAVKAVQGNEDGSRGSDLIAR